MSLVDLTYLLIKKKGIRITRKSLQRLLYRHSDYPSLAALSDISNLFRIKNKSVKILTKDLYKVPLPAIGHLSGSDGQFVLIERVNETGVSYVGESGVRVKEYVGEFEQKWKGVLFMVQDGLEVEEAGYLRLRIQEIFEQYKFGFAITAYFFIALAAILGGEDHWHIFSNLMLVTLGLSAGTLLIAKELNIHSKGIAGLCSIHSIMDCDAVLTSRFSTIIGGIKLAHLVFIYFWGQLFFYYFSISARASQGSDTLFLITSLLALPITIFSVGYQIWVIRKFCFYCVCISIVIWLQCILFIEKGPIIPLQRLNGSVYFIFLLSYAIPIGVLLVISHITRDRGILLESKFHFDEIKKNKEVVRLLHEREEQVNVEVLEEELILGEGAGNFLVTAVLNLHCRKCLETVQWLELLLLRYPGKVGVLIRFWADIAVRDEESTRVAAYLTALNDSSASGIYLDSIREWYATGDFKKWSRGRLVEGTGGLNPVLLHQNKWICQQKISNTPYILINGKKKPDILSLEDIDVIIDRNP